MCLSTGRDLTQQVRPPRSLFVNFPMGNAFGAPFDTDMQMAILRAVLGFAMSARTPGQLVDLPFVWPQEFGFKPGQSRM